MLSKKSAVVVSATLAAMLTACETTGGKEPASASARPNSSWCQGDSELGYAAADSAGQDDPGNQMDTDETVKEIQAHNARLRAACPHP